MSIEHITTHVELALADLPSQFRDSTNIRNYITILAQQIQTFEDDVNDFLSSLGIENAAGDILDKFALLVGEARNGLSDTDFKGFVQARISTNISCGEIERIIAIAKAISGATKVRYIPVYPAGYQLEIFRDASMEASLANRVYNQIVSATAAGVGVAATQVFSNTFILSAIGNTDFDGALHGLSAIGSDSGGKLTCLIGS